MKQYRKMDGVGKWSLTNSLVATRRRKRKEKREMQETYEKEIELLKAKLKELLPEEEYKAFIKEVNATVYDEVIQWML